MSSEFCLRWNNHRPNLVSVFKELLQHEVLVDVTLAAEGQFIHAHKLVLSACSLYFKELFAGNPCQHPIVILKDFRLADLKTVVDFIYQGEVNVKQERLPHVLKAAESLRIKGLAENPHSFEEFQTGAAASQHNAPGTPRLGSQASSLQQSSSLSDSREQSLSLEGEEGDNNGPPASHSPPTKRRRLGHYDDHDSTHDGSSDAVRVKEEPSGGGGASASGDERKGTVGDGHQGYRGRDQSLLLLPGGGISPSEGVGVGGVGECSSPVPPDPATGGSSPTPPPSLPATPSLSITNAATNNGDSNSSSGGGGAAAALTPPDSAALLPHPNPGGVEDWREVEEASQPQPASVQAVTAPHSTTADPSSSTNSDAPTTPHNDLTILADDGAQNTGGQSASPIDPPKNTHHPPNCTVRTSNTPHNSTTDNSNDGVIEKVNCTMDAFLDSSDTKITESQLTNGNTINDDSSEPNLNDISGNSSSENNPTSLCCSGRKTSITVSPPPTSPTHLVKVANTPIKTSGSSHFYVAKCASYSRDQTQSPGSVESSPACSPSTSPAPPEACSPNHSPVGSPHCPTPPRSSNPHDRDTGYCAGSVKKASKDPCRSPLNRVVNITPKNSDTKTSSLIAEALRKLKNASNSLTIVNISTTQPPSSPPPSSSSSSKRKSLSKSSPTLGNLPCSSTTRQSFMKTEIIEEESQREFNFEAYDNKPLLNSSNMASIDSKDFIANLLNNCTGSNPGNSCSTSDTEASSAFDLSQTAAMMMMLNNNNTSVTPAPATLAAATAPHRRHLTPASPYGVNGGGNSQHYGARQFMNQPGTGVVGTPFGSGESDVSCLTNPSHGSNSSSGGTAGGGGGNDPLNMNNISLPSLLAPLGPHAPSFFLAPHSWHQQFRCMSPNMLMAIEAVRAGKMGFTQAGRTFGVNGRTLWVYYRRLGYKVHNTFRGRRSKDVVGLHGQTAPGMVPPLGSLPQALGNHHLSNNIASIGSNRMASNFANANSSIFFSNSSNNVANNNFSNVGALGNPSSNFFARNVPGGNLKYPVDSQNSGFHNFQSKFFENNMHNSDCGNSSSTNNSGDASTTNQTSLPSCGIGSASSNSYANNSGSSAAPTDNTGTNGSNLDSSSSAAEVPVPSPSSLIGPMFGSSYNHGDAAGYGNPSVVANTHVPAEESTVSGQPLPCSQQQASFSQATGFAPIFFGNGGHNSYPVFGGGGGEAPLGVAPEQSGGSHVKQEGSADANTERQISESAREVEETNSTLEALLEACTNRGVWQHSAM